MVPSRRHYILLYMPDQSPNVACLSPKTKTVGTLSPQKNHRPLTFFRPRTSLFFQQVVVQLIMVVCSLNLSTVLVLFALLQLSQAEEEEEDPCLPKEADVT